MDCEKRCPGCFECAALVTALFAAMIVGILSRFGILSTLSAFFWMAFGLGVLNLIFLFAAALYAQNPSHRPMWGCFYKSGRYLLGASVGMIACAMMALSANPCEACAVTSILAGLSTFFAVLMLAAAAVFFDDLFCALHVEEEEE